MRKTIITISREFGSGGRTIGREVAARLGWKFYDKEIIEAVAKESGFSKEYIERQGEHAPGGNIFSYAFVGRTADGISILDQLWLTQRKLILEIAEKEPCVIVGRCADYILKDREDAVHLFIHASEDKKAERIVREYGETDRAPEKRLKEKDRKRALNYKYYTDRNWGDVRNYHMTLNSGELGINECVEMICHLVR